MRIYVSATLPLLRQWLTAGGVPADHAPAYAVTSALRESFGQADLDELEHAASQAAAVGSLRLLAADSAAPRRRVVLAADVDDGAVRQTSPSAGAAAMVTGSVPMACWASALVDAPDVDAVLRAAIAALDGAEQGETDAQFALDEAEAHELGWYAVQELRYLS